MKRPFLFLTCCLFFLSCIGEDLVDDYVDPNLRITNAIRSIREGLSYQFEAQFFDESGRKVENPNLEWSAVPPNAVEIQPNGTIKALKEGNVMLRVTTSGLQGNTIETVLSFDISPQMVTETTTPTSDTSTSTSDTSTSTNNTATSTMDTSTSTMDNDNDEMSNNDDGIVTVPQFFTGQIRSTSSYTLQGGYRYENNGTQIVITIDETYRASTSLPGLYLYLTNNPNSPEDGFEVGAVSVFQGAHSYTLPASISLMDYKYLLYWCKPFRVKVGDAQLFDN